MRVYIKTAEGRSFRFPVPLWLVRLVLSMGSPVIGIAAGHIDESVRKNLDAVDFKSLSRCIKDLKKHKGLQIIAVKCANGEEVEITL